MFDEQGRFLGIVEADVSFDKDTERPVPRRCSVWCCPRRPGCLISCPCDDTGPIQCEIEKNRLRWLSRVGLERWPHALALAAPEEAALDSRAHPSLSPPRSVGSPIDFLLRGGPRRRPPTASPSLCAACGKHPTGRAVQRPSGPVVFTYAKRPQGWCIARPASAYPLRWRLGILRRLSVGTAVNLGTR